MSLYEFKEGDKVVCWADSNTSYIGHVVAKESKSSVHHGSIYRVQLTEYIGGVSWIDLPYSSAWPYDHMKLSNPIKRNVE